MATHIKKEILNFGGWAGTHQITKDDFLPIIQVARENGITEKNVISAWRKAGLFPFDPEVVIAELPSKRMARSKVLGPKKKDIVRPVTRNTIELPILEPPKDISDVVELTARLQISVQQGEIPFLQVATSLAKTTVTALAENALHQATNSTLVAQVIRKENKKSGC